MGIGAPSRTVIFTGRMLEPESLREMTRFGKADYFEQYGLGVARLDVRGHEVWAHGGRIPGFASDLYHLTNVHITLAVAVNDGGWPLEDTTSELVSASVEREPQ